MAFFRFASGAVDAEHFQAILSGTASIIGAVNLHNNRKGDVVLETIA